MKAAAEWIAALPAVVGETPVTITVTAEDGDTPVYTVTVVRMQRYDPADVETVEEISNAISVKTSLPVALTAVPTALVTAPIAFLTGLQLPKIRRGASQRGP